MAELGALSLRIQEQGGDTVVAKLRQIDNAARLTDVGATKASASQKLLNREIAQTTQLWALQARTADLSNAQMVNALKKSAAEQLNWMQSVGASDQQLLRHAANIQAFERRVNAATGSVTAMSPKIRSGASAVAALSIAAATGGGSLAGMATQAGLVASVMASEFAPAKWAGYAAGIGAVVIGLTALVGILVKLRQEQAKPSEFVTKRIADLKLLQDAEAEYNKRRADTERARAALEEVRRLSAGSPSVGLTRQAADVKKAEAIEREALLKFQQLRNAATIQGAEVERDAIVKAAEATRTVRLSEIAKEQAAVEAAFQQGTVDLRQQYDARRQAVIDGANAERAALEAARARKLQFAPGTTEVEKQAARGEAREIGAEIKALANETAARLTALDQQRAAEERALASKVLGYQVQLEQFSDTAFQRRMEQINAEDAERRRVLAQRGGATAQELADLDALTEKQKSQLFLQKAQADLARLQADLRLRIADIQNQETAGLIDAEEASRRIADIQRSALPSLQEAVNRAIEWAEKLGDQGVLGALKEIKAELAQPILLNIDIQTDAITKRMQQELARIQALVNTGVLSEEAGRKLVQQQQLAAGFASALSESIAQGGAAALQGKNPLQALGNALSSSFGSLLVDVGTQWLKASVIMAKIQAFFLANPIAAIAAAGALIVFGSAIGGKSGGGAAGGFAGGSTAPSPISISRFVVDPNAGLRQRVAGTGRLSTVAPAAPLQPIQVVGMNRPDVQAALAVSVGNYARRGG